ncbi:hypothetical protein SteCoe_35612 [Stentor coeruleus]|uniref:Protein kinase domain-containing protein n=1 Tax=Stentor coeruleus TaxID=5963 RepID=A0A1R2ARX2_9CILI|nr:hypothetical protein SteCoe_35612 [Stentor coeruleus]
MKNTKKRVVGHYVLKKEIGFGTYGRVYLGEDLSINEIRAIKKISNSQLVNPRFKEALEREISIMKRLHHKNIVKLYDYIATSTSTYLVMEFCEDGDMKKLISQAIGEQKAVFFLRQIISALKILKENKVVHRDLKPANILITGDSIIKIADFGLARTIDPESLAKTFAGTLAYMAPEVFDAKINNERYDYRADIWSVGCILYELITGIKPFNPPDVSRIKTSINSSLKSENFLNSPEFSPSCKDFLKKIFQIDPNNRINFEEFCNHELVTGIPTLAEFNDYSLPCFEVYPQICEEKEALEFADTVIQVEKLVRYPFILYMKACELLRPFLYNEICKRHFKLQYESAKKDKNRRNWHMTNFVEVALETAVLLCQSAERENKKKALTLLKFVGNNPRVLAFKEAIENDLDRDL